MEQLTHNSECPFCGAGIETVVTADYSTIIAAVRAEERARVREIVEAYRRTIGGEEQWAAGEDFACGLILAILSTTEGA